MPDSRPTRDFSHTTLIAMVVVVGVLFVAREVLIPLALALLLAFLLAPLVVRLYRWGFGRVPSVLCVVALAFMIVAILGGLVAVQLTDLAHQLPQYQQNIHNKIQALRVSSRGALNRLSRATEDFSREWTPAPAQAGSAGEEKPVPVEIRRGPFSPLALVQKILGSVINLLLMVVIVVVFVIFMLFQREDLRDRLIRLVGWRQLNVTTRALDEAGRRVSRFLLAQLAVNGIYGLLVGIGLYIFGIPNPVLWAVLAMLFRYVPYLGIWIAAVMPAAVAVAVSPDWLKPLGVFGLYIGIDLLMYNFLEPPLYGSSTGITPMAILVAAVFWTWLWGPVGLLLSTPLTVCVVVIGRYVPRLAFLSVLLSDEEMLSPDKRFYQRLLAMDIEEATEVAEVYLRGRSLEELYDNVFLPALNLAEEDRHRGKLDKPRQRFILKNTRSLVLRFDEKSRDSSDAVSGAASRATADANGSNPVTVLSASARDEADEIAALMLARLLQRHGVRAQSISVAAINAENWQETVSGTIKLVCVSAVPPSGYMHARFLCKRLRTAFPGLKIAAAILNGGEEQDVRNRDPKIMADIVATNLRQAVSEIVASAPVAESRVETHPAATSAAGHEP